MSPVAPNAPLEQAANVRLLALDVDGVLTDGRLHFDADGRESKVFHVRDGHGIKEVLRAGIAVAVISGRRSHAVETRMDELGVHYVRQGVNDKLGALHDIANELQIPLAAVACVGDDTLDLPIMAAVGLAIAVADAHPAVCTAAGWCTELPGGRGAVREVCDLLLAAQQSPGT